MLSRFTQATYGIGITVLKKRLKTSKTNIPMELFGSKICKQAKNPYLNALFF